MQVLNDVRPKAPDTAGGLVTVLERQPGAEYGETSFLYLLHVERARAGRANRFLRLLLATLEAVPDEPVPFPPATAARLFRGLKQALRETDVTGWYREHQVVGAVLSERADAPGSNASSAIERRVGDQLRRRLPSVAARALRVRVIHLPL